MNNPDFESRLSQLEARHSILETAYFTLSAQIKNDNNELIAKLEQMPKYMEDIIFRLIKASIAESDE